MKRISLSIFFALFVFFIQVQAQTDSAEIVKQQMDETLQNRDFVRASQLIDNTLTKETLSDAALVEYCFNIFILAQDSTTNTQDRELVEKSILELSKDSLFQTSYGSLLLVKEEYRPLMNYLDQLQEKYPQNRKMYLHQKGSAFLYLDEYLRAEPIYDQLIEIDKDNGFVYMDIGYYGMKYAEKIYNNGEEYDYVNDGSPKNKKDALPYFDKAIKNMVMAYKLFTDDQRCDTHVLVFLNDLVAMLIEEGVISQEDLKNYMEGMDFSNYYCS